MIRTGGDHSSLGAVAYGMALGAGSIFELVQQASGIGCAGMLVLVVFGLFSRRAGARTGYATRAAGLGVWAYGTWIGGSECPYLLSLVSALGAFVLAALVESRGSRIPGEP